MKSTLSVILRRTPFLAATALSLFSWSRGMAVLADDQGPAPFQNFSVLIVKRIPVTADATKEFGTIAGIERVYVNPKARRVTFKIKPGTIPSDTAIWQAAEQFKWEPVRLVTGHRTYTGRPGSDFRPEAKNKTRQGPGK